MKADELRQKTIDELKSLLAKEKGEAEKLMLDILQKKEKNHSKAKYLRSEIARINSVISEKRIISAEGR